eukprot:gene13569-16591_t
MASICPGQAIYFAADRHHPLMATRGMTLADLGSERILVRERGSGTRTTVERIFKDASQQLRIGSEMSSNEAIKQMCAAGFGAGGCGPSAGFSPLVPDTARLSPALTRRHQRVSARSPHQGRHRRPAAAAPPISPPSAARSGEGGRVSFGRSGNSTGTSASSLSAKLQLRSCLGYDG